MNAEDLRGPRTDESERAPVGRHRRATPEDDGDTLSLRVPEEAPTFAFTWESDAVLAVSWDVTPAAAASSAAVPSPLPSFSDVVPAQGSDVPAAPFPDAVPARDSDVARARGSDVAEAFASNAVLARGSDVAVAPSSDMVPAQGSDVALAAAAAARASDAALAREHQLARQRAKLMDPRTAAGELAERLRSAHADAGRPALSALEVAVGYRSETMAQVLAGELVPSWVLVRELGAVLGVSPDVVVQDWFALWTAANIHRGRHDANRERTPTASASNTVPAPTAPASTGPAPTAPTSTGPTSTGPAPAAPTASGLTPTGPALTGPAPTGPALTGPAPTGPALTGPAHTGPSSIARTPVVQMSAASAAETGYTCAECGSWVVDTARHTDWHEAMESAGRSASLADSLGADWNARSHDISMLHVALGTHERKV
jgi:hypothetical protein